MTVCAIPSESARAAPRPPQQRTCLSCGETFEQRDPRQRFCDIWCFEAATRRGRGWHAKRLIIPTFMLLAVFALPALADTVTLSWVAPTANEDGSALSDGEIGWYVLTESGGAPGDDNTQFLASTTFSAVETITCGTAIFDIAALTASGSLGAFAETTYTVAAVCKPQANSLYAN